MPLHTLHSLSAKIHKTNQRFLESHGVLLATNLSYNTLLAVVPISALLLFLSLQIDYFSSAFGQIREHLLMQLLPTSREQVESYLIATSQNIRSLSYLTISIILLSVVWLSLSIERAVNDLWHVQVPRRLYLRIPTHIILWLLLPMLMALSLTITTWLMTTTQLQTLSTLASTLSYMIPWFITSSALYIMYYFVPNTSIQSKYALISAIFTGLTFELSKYVFTLYINYFAMYDKIYGTLAALPSFMLWLFISWAIILWGITLCITLQSDNDTADIIR